MLLHGSSALFMFSRLFSISGNKYHVSVNDQNGVTHFFTMEQKTDSFWKIVDAPKVAEWIMEIESVLAQTVLDANE